MSVALLPISFSNGNQQKYQQSFYHKLLSNPNSLKQFDFNAKFVEICRRSLNQGNMNSIVQELQHEISIFDKLGIIKFTYIKQYTCCNSNVDKFNQLFPDEKYISIQKMCAKILQIAKIPTDSKLHAIYWKASKYFDYRLNLVSTPEEKLTNQLHDHSFLVLSSNYSNMPLLLFPIEINGEYYVTEVGMYFKFT